MAPLQAMVHRMAQRPKPLFKLQIQNLYTELEEVRFFTPWLKPLKHLNKSKSVIICPKVNLKPHIETPKQNSEEIT